MDFKECFSRLNFKYKTPNRFYHTLEHVNYMLQLVPEDKTVYKYFCLFHDIIYDAKKNDNEEKSVEFFNSVRSDIHDLTEQEKDLVVEMILATKTHKFLSEYEETKVIEELDRTTEINNDITKILIPEKTNSDIINMALILDLSILGSFACRDILEFENKIFKEYQHLNIEKYVEERIKVLQKLKKNIIETNYKYKETYGMVENLNFLLEHLKYKTYKIGIYAGSFNPFHKGHLNILEHAEKLFDKVIIARGINSSKGRFKFKLPSNLNNEIIQYKGLVTDLFKDSTRAKYYLIRGLRNEYDLAQEENLRNWIKEINPNIEIVYIFSDQKYEKVSSTMIKELLKLKPELAKEYLV